jgi:hypothetical protein
MTPMRWPPTRRDMLLVSGRGSCISYKRKERKGKRVANSQRHIVIEPWSARKLTLASRRYRASAWNSFIRTKEAFRLHQQRLPCILYHIEKMPRNERHLMPSFSGIPQRCCRRHSRHAVSSPMSSPHQTQACIATQATSHSRRQQ